MFQHSMMQHFGCFEALDGSLDFSLVINSQKIAGIITQKIGFYTGRTSHGQRYAHFTRHFTLRFPSLYLFAGRNDSAEMALFIEQNAVGDFCYSPSFCLNFSLLAKLLI